MSRICCSALRCSSIYCAACTWRYSLQVSRRILACEPRRLHRVTIICTVSSIEGFGRWRTTIHNVVNYRRRQSRWWADFGIWLWWAGSSVRGIIKLGSITAEEFAIAFSRHGQACLGPMTNDDVRAEAYAAARSATRASAESDAGRFQSIKLAIQPVAPRIP